MVHQEHVIVTVIDAENCDVSCEDPSLGSKDACAARSAAGLSRRAAAGRQPGNSSLAGDNLIALISLPPASRAVRAAQKRPIQAGASDSLLGCSSRGPQLTPAAPQSLAAARMPPAGFPGGAVPPGAWPGAGRRSRGWRRNDQHTLLSLGMLLAQQVAAMDRKPPLTLALVAGAQRGALVGALRGHTTVVASPAAPGCLCPQPAHSIPLRSLCCSPSAAVPEAGGDR